MSQYTVLAGIWRVLFPSCSQPGEVNPFGGTNLLGTASVFVRVLLHLLAGEGVWGRGRHLSPRPQQPLRNLFLVLFVHKSLNRCASIVGLAFGLALKFFRRSITKCGMQALPIVILVDVPGSRICERRFLPASAS